MASRRIALLPLLAVSAAAISVSALRADPPTAPTPTHRTIERHWPDGAVRERKQVLVLPDGTTVDDGPFERWYIDGTKEYEAVFVRGKKEGTTVRYHRNGRVASREEYHDGKRDGLSVSWNPQGEKVKQESWSDGLPDGTWTIWEDGRVAWTHTFRHGDPSP
jgi:antitoxin component YwqK of YwqJK toxin-antitoxin module